MRVGQQHVPGDGDRRREQPKERAIGTHPTDVNREERRDKRDDPPSIDRRTRRLAGLDLRRHRDNPRVGRKAQLRDDRLLGIRSGVDRRDRNVPGDAEDPQRHRERQGPHSGPVSSRDDQQHNRQIPEHRQCGQPACRPICLAPRAQPIPDGIDEEEAGHRRQERRAGEERGVDQEERNHHADERSDRRLPARDSGRSPDAVQHLERCGDGQQESDARRRRLRGAKRTHQGEHAEQARRTSQTNDRRALAQELSEGTAGIGCRHRCGPWPTQYAG